jgi:23S rRNA (uracil-5-)-methyltransferase RumA
MTDLCPHFGVCGGCASQDVPYDQQLAAKDAMIRAVVEPFAPTEIRPIAPSPDLWHYRNKMEFAFGGLKDAPPLLGLRRKGRFDLVVDLAECRILSPEAGPLLAAVRGWAAAEGLPTYHLKSHKGFLRYLAVREGKNSGERMVHLVTASGTAPKDSFLRAIDASGVRVDTVIWSVNPDLSDVAYGVVKEIWRGAGVITERLEGKPYVITPTGFFQTNTRATERLYGVVRDFVGEAETLVDMYCGAGTIGLFCADRVKRIVGVELHAPSVESARENARLQNNDRATFIVADAAVAVRDPGFRETWSHPGTVAVLDPPRPGLAPAVRELLLAAPPARWVYVSCNPKALATDLATLSAGFHVETVQAVDLFPHTPHVETVLLLKAKG